MFETVQADEIFDLSKGPFPEEHPAYWLAQLRKADWQTLLTYAGLTVPTSSTKPMRAQAALERFEFEVCGTRAQVWQVWQAMQNEKQRGLVIQFRHPETDWTRGVPEFVYLERDEPLGFVNIAGRLVCKLK